MFVELLATSTALEKTEQGSDEPVTAPANMQNDQEVLDKSLSVEVCPKAQEAAAKSEEDNAVQAKEEHAAVANAKAPEEIVAVAKATEDQTAMVAKANADKQVPPTLSEKTAAFLKALEETTPGMTKPNADTGTVAKTGAKEQTTSKSLAETEQAEKVVKQAVQEAVAEIGVGAATPTEPLRSSMAWRFGRVGAVQRTASKRPPEDCQEAVCHSVFHCSHCKSTTPTHPSLVTKRFQHRRQPTWLSRPSPQQPSRRPSGRPSQHLFFEGALSAAWQVASPDAPCQCFFPDNAAGIQGF